MRLYFVNYVLIIYTIFNFHGSLVCTSSLDDYFPYNSLTEDMRKAGFSDGIRDFNFVVPKKLDADDWQLSHYFEANDDSGTPSREKISTVEHSPRYLLPLRNKDHSAELELQIELKPNVELAPRSLMIERFNRDSKLDVGKAKLRQLEDNRCYFVGHVSGQPGSTVALSACSGGLLGVVQLSDDRFYIQPLTSGGAHGGKKNVHIVYRKKSRDDGKQSSNCLVKEPNTKKLDNLEESHLYGNLKLPKSKYVDLYNFENPILDKHPKPRFEIDNNEFFEKQRESSIVRNIHPALNHRKRRDVEISKEHNHEEMNSHDISTLDDEGGSLELNSTLSCDEPTNCGSQEVENSLNETIRAGRSCELVQHKRKIEPVYDVRVLVVASKHFCEQFDTFDVETLILTLMNMVHAHFHDATIGQLLYVKIVRIIFVEYNLEELDERKHSLEELFANFCKFQEQVNPLLTSHPNRHDIAVFLTQSALHNKCGNPPVYGATFSRSVCRDDKRCILVTNHGLLTANIITHALGHSLGAGHDDGAEGNCQSRSAEDGSSHLMSPTVTYGAVSWSPCSRRAVTRFVWHHAYKCLKGYSKPVNFKWTRELLPGQIYTASQQCTLNYRMQTVACFNGDFCSKLYCQMNDHECVTNGEPPADGTYCAKNMWCVKGECLWKGAWAGGAEAGGAINGGWSEWSDWTPCSRHCGVGVQRANRYCNNPPPARGGKICAGRRTRYRVCNQHVPCPISDPSFRDEQCQLTSGDWEPRTDWHEWSAGGVEAEVGCALVCESFTGVVAVRDVGAANGSPCRPGTNDLCVRGQCVPLGCDWVLGSRTRRDACGICRGGGTACKIIQGVYNERNGTGYVPFLKAPRGSAMIYVRQMKPSDALLAVSSSNAGDFYLNGPSTDDDLVSSPALSRRFELAGASAIYKVKSGMERLFIDGTVQEDLIFFLKFGNQGNPGIRYQLAVTRDKKSEFEPSYSWRFIEWEPCSSPCGGGYQVAEPVCVEDTNGLVDDSFCPDELKPWPITRLCNSFPCKPKWWTGPWSKCLKRGDKRIKTRVVLCIFTPSSTSPTFKIIQESRCSCRPKPLSSKLCKNQSASTVEGPCPDIEETLQSNSRYHQPMEADSHDMIINNRWKEQISNTIDNVGKPSLENYDDNERISNDSQLSEQMIEEVNSQLNSSLQQRSVPRFSINEELLIEGYFDTFGDDSSRMPSEINGKVRRKKSNKSKNKKSESDEDEVFDQFFLDADDSSTVISAMKHSTQPEIQDNLDEYSTQKIKDDNRRKHLNKSKINSLSEENSRLKSKEVKKLTSKPTGTLYGLLLTNKMGEPSTLKITKTKSSGDDLNREKDKEDHSVVPDEIEFVELHENTRTESITTELIEVVASKEKQKIEVSSKDEQKIEALSKEKQKIRAQNSSSKEVVDVPARRTEVPTESEQEMTLATGPTCQTRVTTCRHPDLCYPTAAPDTPKKICHEIIENDLSSFVLIRAPIACERSLNSYSDGMYEGDGLLSLLPVVNETCPVFLKGDAALKYLEDSRRCVSGPIQQNNLLAVT